MTDTEKLNTPRQHSFGYPCQLCHSGTARRAVKKDYPVKFGGVRFVVPDAVIGECDVCGAVCHHGPEYKRWRALFEEAQRA